MISFSLLLNCRFCGPVEALAVFGIPQADISSYTDASADFLAMQRNGALVSKVSGAFTHAADVFLYDYDDSTQIEAELLALSQHGVDVAMPVSEGADPEVYRYWHMGHRRILRVVDVDGELELVDSLSKPDLE